MIYLTKSTGFAKLNSVAGVDSVLTIENRKGDKMIKGKKELALIATKERERFIFIYREGQEREICRAIKEQAARKEINLNSFDAGVLILITQLISSQVDEVGEEEKFLVDLSEFYQK